MSPLFKDQEIIYLHLGEIFYSSRPVIVSTLLGSCLSVTMFCKEKKFGAISHCQLPKCKCPDCKDCSEPYKYVDCTIKKMLGTFDRMKISFDNLEIKMFGGADVLDSLSKPKKGNTIGHQNIVSALRMLENLNLKVTASDTGGKLGRKIFFNTETGEVFLRKMKNNEANKSFNSR